MRCITVVRNLLLITVGLVLLSGCSISYSSGKSSDSSVSSVSSGGGDSKDADKEINSYISDVIAATDHFVSQGGNGDEFQRRISYLAGKHGITDWGSEKTTFIAMGKGLKRAGIKEDRIATLPYFSTVTQAQSDLLLQGYK